MRKATEHLACADCEACPLGKFHREQGTFAPVPMEQHDEATATIVTFFPKKRDTEILRPLMDSNEGALVVDAITAAGWRRENLNWTTVVACRYPKDDEQAFHRQLSKDNAKLKKSGLPEIPSPVACCAPKLQADIANETNIIALGNEAARATLKNPKKIDEIRGAPARGLSPAGRRGNAGLTEPAKVLPSFAPRTVVRAPRFRNIFRSDIARARRFFEDRLNWVEPKVVIAPTPNELRDFFARCEAADVPFTLDVETMKKAGHDEFDALDDELKCIGVGSTDEAYVLPYRSTEDPPVKYYEEEDLQAITEILREAFVNPTLRKYGHNSGYYDRMVIERFFGVTPAPMADNIVAHYLGDNELPHRLGFVASQYLDVPAWKSEHAATEAKTDHELYVYNATDCVVTQRCVPFVRKSVLAKKQGGLYAKEVQKQEYAVGMHKLGLPIDRMRVAWHTQSYREKRDSALAIVQAAAGKEFNPRSTPQLRRFFYEDCGLPIHKLTDTLEPSTDDETLRLWIYDASINDGVREVLRSLRVFRATDKVLGTYLKVFLARNRPESTRGRTLYGDAKRLGWIHPDYNSASAKTGRYTSSDPNAQNEPATLRDVHAAPDGFVLIDADEDQLELRLAAAVAGAKLFLRCLNGQPPFPDGKLYEPHNVSGTLVFGERYWEVTGAPEDRTKKGSGRFKDLRDLIKRVFYLFQYGGGVDRLLGVVQEAENDFGEPLYPEYFGDQGRAKVALIRQKLMDQIPEYKNWWQSCTDFFARNGYIQDPIWGRRRYFTDGEDFNAEVNYAVQAGGFAIIMDGLFACLKHTPFNFAAGTGPLTQTHDSTLQLVTLADSERARAEIERDLNSTHLGMKFAAKAEIQRRWKEIVRKEKLADGTVKEHVDDREWEKEVPDWERVNWALLSGEWTDEQAA